MMNSKNIRDIEVNLNTKNVEDQVAALLYALGVVKDNEDVMELKLNPNKDCYNIKLKLRKNSEVNTINHNV